jgi:gluconate 2-dehydrogenase gamma chain
MANDVLIGHARRDFLKQMGVVAGALPLPHRVIAIASVGAVVVAGSAIAKAADSPAAAPFTGYQYFGPNEASFVEALVNVMCPADDLTPSGVDCGLATYIDRQLAGGFGHGEGRYMRGPWKNGKPQLGWQMPLTPEQFFKAGIAAAADACAKKYGKSFDLLAAAAANAFLLEVQGGKVAESHVPLALWFNELVYPLFVQACFADPMYGGNYDKVFWKMIGYPGLPATHTLDMVRYRGKPYPGAAAPKSIADFG